MYPTYRIGSSIRDFQLQISITRFTPRGVVQVGKRTLSSPVYGRVRETLSLE